jgi:hypothetical protein
VRILKDPQHYKRWWVNHCRTLAERIAKRHRQATR